MTDKFGWSDNFGNNPKPKHRPVNIQVIFESQNGDLAKRDGWLDYCREQAPAQNLDEAYKWAKVQADLLSKRIGHATRYRIEDWT